MLNISYKVLILGATILLLAFLITAGIDLIRYNEYKTSAPLYLYIIVRALVFALPSAILFVVAVIIRCKIKKR